MKQHTSIWIDALDFTEKGGWLEDTQYVHLMGSGYLIAAHEPGMPVDDARLTVEIPKTDTYRIWVRDRNWLRPHDPGQFQLLVNGHETDVILGKQPSDAWVWEIAGDYALEAGDCELALHDLTGYFSRCAAILITNDFDFVPSREVERMQKERAIFKGMEIETAFGGHYDVIIAGGGPGGVPAAIACARMGVKTLLLQNRPMLGGNGSSEVGITFDGAAVGHTFSRETGIAEEIRRLRDWDPDFSGDWTRAMEKLAAAEENLTVMCERHVCGAEMADLETIRAVTVLDIRNLTKTQYTGSIFIDCTGDGWLGYFAGAKTRFGREATHQHNEDAAPTIADTLTMSGCIKGDTRKFFETADHPVEYHAPDWVPKLPETDEEFGRVINGAQLHWWLEAPNTYDDMWDGEQARDALLLVVLGFYNHLKNHWSKKDTVKNSRLVFASVFDGRRESRRLIGDYILTQEDCETSRSFDDAITYTGWALDIHHPKGIYSGKEGPLYYAQHVKQPKIPYRCIYSKNIRNLLFAGRNISVTHIALGTARVQNTIATIGQAAGTAAAMCIKLGETPRGIYQRHIKDLQQLLIKNDQWVPGLRNEDPNDPCLQATVTASSVSRTEAFRNKMGVIGELRPLNVKRKARLNVKAGRDVQALYCQLHSACSEPVTVTMHAYAVGGDIDTFSVPGEEITVQAVVAPMGESWVKFDLSKTPLPGGGAVVAVLEPAAGISWRTIENLTFYFILSEMGADGKWKTESRKTYVIHPYEPKPVVLANCEPENVINGHSRIIDAEHYEWVSDPEQKLPQWIELQFKERTVIDSVSVVFDTDLTNPGTCWGVKFPGVPVCVKDYTVSVFDGSNWVEIAQVTENFMRKRTHRFDAMQVERLRITVQRTWGNPSARIIEVQAGLLGNGTKTIMSSTNASNAENS